MVKFKLEAISISSTVYVRRPDNVGGWRVLAAGPSNDRRTPQDAADRHETLFLVIFWAQLMSRQQLTMIWINAKLSRIYFKFNFDVFNFT